MRYASVSFIPIIKGGCAGAAAADIKLSGGRLHFLLRALAVPLQTEPPHPDQPGRGTGQFIAVHQDDAILRYGLDIPPARPDLSKGGASQKYMVIVTM